MRSKSLYNVSAPSNQQYQMVIKLSSLDDLISREMSSIRSSVTVLGGNGLIPTSSIVFTDL
jgi:hypothetical protein